MVLAAFESERDASSMETVMRSITFIGLVSLMDVSEEVAPGAWRCPGIWTGLRIAVNILEL
jgi:hypothetical protein